jgi:ribosomal protein L20A (L18A)
MYKIFKVTYNDGGWHSGDLPHFYYIAESEEEVIANSKEYQDYLERQKMRGGDIRISEISEVIGTHGLVYEFYFENLQDFNIEISVKKKD